MRLGATVTCSALTAAAAAAAPSNDDDDANKMLFDVGDVNTA